MLEAEDIRDWRDHAVVDQTGAKIGSLEAVYFDTSTELPAFATVKVGLLNGSRLIFVPLDGATVSPKAVKVSIDKKVAKDAPAIDTDGELPASLEPAIYQHYGMTYQAGASGERRLGRR
ncbi:hypothetical protein FHX74_001083 [Friedmanniella endophytica]|uniref:PRC-barrel domain-containing protein n=1 Tax=Microlunatus kandeliicorticis TaxID=1759536 RepID=A0A7W3IQQ3_9ACTN|nr:PRC-barrel domain-containing protein [Microlunatus kandeliicorticis]MBA8793478.1 hypothetical protein [Microlunatus kandeliicorticis]